MNRKDLRALTLVGSTSEHLVLDPLSVQHLHNVFKTPMVFLSGPELKEFGFRSDVQIKSLQFFFVLIHLMLLFTASHKVSS